LSVKENFSYVRNFIGISILIFHLQKLDKSEIVCYYIGGGMGKVLVSKPLLPTAY